MACYLFLITVQKKKNAGFTHFITWINIKTIFSEKYPYRKGHTDPIFTVCSKSIKFVQINVHLHSIPKKKGGWVGRKDIFIQLNNCWKGSGAVDYIIVQKPNDVLILEIMWRFCRRMHPLWIKHIEWFRWCGKCEHFFPLLGVFCTFYPERKLCFKTNKSIP